jgi:hypothetical protein
MTLTIRNGETLDRWMNERRQLGHDIFAIKGPPPEGSTYDDGDLITRPVNIAWRDGTTGEIFAIEYEDADLAGKEDKP